VSPSLIPVRRFDRDSAVTAHWLTRCEGFRVRSRRRRGVVENVVLDPRNWHAEYLVVRYRGLGRRRIVPAGAVDAIVPAEHLLVLRSPGRLVRGATAVGRAGRATARRSAPWLARAGATIAHGARVAAVWTELVVVGLARRAAAVATRAAAARW
jgi:hypothetical protein